MAVKQQSNPPVPAAVCPQRETLHVICPQKAQQLTPEMERESEP